MKKKSKRIWLAIIGAAILNMSGCGGGGGGGSTSGGSVGSTASAGTVAPVATPTVVSGIASKGPLNGSTVCAFSIVAGSKGSALGTCAGNIVNGQYSIDIGTYTGPVLFEASGGTYSDEATGTTVTLAAPLHSMLSNAAGGAISVAITPLTELAYQNANAISAGLTSERIQTSTASVQTNFGVADIINTMPADALNIPISATAAQKSYALALATVSQFQSGQQAGTSLTNALQMIQTCIATPGTGCGTGATKIGALLNIAMSTFKTNHADLASVTLPVASIGTVPVAGAVSTPKLSFDKSSLIYTAQENFTTSAAQTVTLSNTGNTGILLKGSMSIPMDAMWVTVSDTCAYAPAIFEAGTSCTISIAFNPRGDPEIRNAYILNQSLGTNPALPAPQQYLSALDVWGDSVTNPQIALPKSSVQLNGTGVYPPAALVPTVSATSPTFGAAGTVVTISGTNFDTTPANNVVKFNGLQATVTAGNTTSLTVIVPNGATTGLVTVARSGGTPVGTTTFVVSPALTGTLSGYVRDALTNTGLAGITVNIYSGSSLVTSVTTDTSGIYTANLPAGNYSLNITKAGYIAANISSAATQTNVTTTIETVLQVSNANSGTGIVSGTIKNAFTGLGLTGVTLNFRTGINTTTGNILATTTAGTNGAYTIFSLTGGSYTVEEISSGYTTGYFTVTSIGGQTKAAQDGTITPVLSAGETRIVLTWGATPTDLDSHLTGPTSGSTSRFHTYYSNRGSSTSAPFAKLDVDDTSSFGPETITISQISTGIYRYSIHDYSNAGSTSSKALSNSGAQIKVYQGGGLVATFNVPVNQIGTLWTVFEFNGTTITPVNTMTNVSSSTSVQ